MVQREMPTTCLGFEPGSSNSFPYEDNRYTRILLSFFLSPSFLSLSLPLYIYIYIYIYIYACVCVSLCIFKYVHVCNGNPLKISWRHDMISIVSLKMVLKNKINSRPIYYLMIMFGCLHTHWCYIYIYIYIYIYVVDLSTVGIIKFLKSWWKFLKIETF